LTISDGRARP